MARFLLHAPGVHVGGGLVLLRELLHAASSRETIANLDARLPEIAKVNKKITVNRVCGSILSRFKAELYLYRLSRADDVTICFHGMPPIFPVRGRVVVFLQNRNYLPIHPLWYFRGKTRLRLAVERLIFRFFRNNVSEYVVQTPSMKTAFEKAYAECAQKIKIFPFVPEFCESTANSASKDIDFIYVADGERHKNHHNLLEAWKMLASEGIYPSLITTIPDRNTNLREELQSCVKQYALKIQNKADLDYSEVAKQYERSKALIFPSTSESFGLPLIEAAHYGLDIIAGELDFVRDVCKPVQTFNPDSPVSIARSVKRYMGIVESETDTHAAEDFLMELGL